MLQAYVNDQASFDLPKSSEAEIIAQVKADVKAALETGAAKGTYEVDWQTKGRVTKWALYALMADACLWSEDYDQCIEYCNMVLNATDTFRPVFMSNTADWYSIFYPGNSNESILELNWDYATNQQNNNFTSLFTLDNSSPLRPTTLAMEKMKSEMQALRDSDVVLSDLANSDCIIYGDYSVEFEALLKNAITQVMIEGVSPEDAYRNFKKNAQEVLDAK